MAFFQFRWPGQKGQAEKASRPSRPVSAESIEVMRRRARHRLMGAALLVLVAVVGFPILFDTQPRPIPVDIPIEIPDRNRVAPLVAPDAPAPAVATTPARASAATAAAAAPAAAESNAPSTASAPASAPPPVARAATPAQAAASVASKRPEARPPSESRPSDVPRSAQPSEAERARALLEGRSVAANAPADGEERFIVQIGAFAEADKAREVRQKLERAGIKTYAQVVDTKDGKRTRGRVGPFGNRAEAEKVAARIKALNLPVSILSL